MNNENKSVWTQRVGRDLFDCDNQDVTEWHKSLHWQATEGANKMIKTDHQYPILLN